MDNEVGVWQAVVAAWSELPLLVQQAGERTRVDATQNLKHRSTHVRACTHTDIAHFMEIASAYSTRSIVAATSACIQESLRHF